MVDEAMTFDDHLQEKNSNANEGIGIISRFRLYIPRDSFLRLFETYIRPHLDYGDITYDQPGNEDFSRKQESVLYNAALAITSCFRGKLYNEL